MRRGRIAVAQTAFVASSNSGDVVLGNACVVAVVSMFECKTVIEHDLQGFGPGLAIALGDAVQFADVVFVADGMSARISLKVWVPVIVDCGPEVIWQNAE